MAAASVLDESLLSLLLVRLVATKRSPWGTRGTHQISYVSSAAKKKLLSQLSHEWNLKAARPPTRAALQWYSGNSPICRDTFGQVGKLCTSLELTCLFSFKALIIIIVCMCVLCVGVCALHSIHVEVRGQQRGVLSFQLLDGLQRSNWSGGLAWPLPAGRFC